ncbi:MAG: putative DNA binding domain-containing protein, partial [Thermomicrobia bacterium]|nr:putative DNA binding domain-containing protein [Thermomicrobia bacterium]
ETDLGIGDRATEVLLPERGFAALKALFVSEDFARIRPYQPVPTSPFDAVQAAREQGPSIIQSFHEQVRSRRSRYRPIVKDVVAFANTNGGTIYVGVSASPTQPAVGVPAHEEAARGLRDALARSVVPKLDVTVDSEASGGKPVLIVTIPKGLNTPYATDAGQVFVRQESETVIALRDEIVQLVREAAASDALPAIDLTRERAWTAARVAPDDDEDADETSTVEGADTAIEEAPVEETPAAPPPSRRPRRRRSSARPPATAEQTDAAASPEPLTPEEVTPPEEPETPDDAPAQDAPPVAADTEAPATEPAAVAEPVVAEAVPAEQTATVTPKPRPRRRTRRPASAAAPQEVAPPAPPAAEEQAVPVGASTPAVSRNGSEPAVVPKAGVEILAIEERGGEKVYTMRDLRSGRVADNVTRKSARRLWRQAILERENGLPAPESITWDGNLGYVGSAVRDGVRRYNLAYRDNGGGIRYFYAVGDEGINEAWRHLVATDS